MFWKIKYFCEIESVTQKCVSASFCRAKMIFRLISVKWTIKLSRFMGIQVLLVFIVHKKGGTYERTRAGWTLTDSSAVFVASPSRGRHNCMFCRKQNTRSGLVACVFGWNWKRGHVSVVEQTFTQQESVLKNRSFHLMAAHLMAQSPSVVLQVTCLWRGARLLADDDRT